jgi:protein SCO1/2
MKKVYKHKEGFISKNRYTVMSLAIICGMFAIVQSYYDPSVNLRKQMLNEQAIQEGKGAPKIGGEFVMETTEGTPFTEKDLLGHYSLIFFGYTFCPDVCPTTLSTLEEVYSGLSVDQQKMVDIIMVTVDPSRDLGASLKEYVNVFHNDFIGIRGTEEQTKSMANVYLAYYAKAGEGEDYGMDHSAYTYLMGPDGKYMHHFRHSDMPVDILKTMNGLLQK